MIKHTVHYERKHRQNFLKKNDNFLQRNNGPLPRGIIIINHITFLLLLTSSYCLATFWLKKYFRSISNTFFRSILKYYSKYFEVSVFVFLFEIHFQVFLPITGYSYMTHGIRPQDDLIYRSIRKVIRILTLKCESVLF